MNCCHCTERPKPKVTIKPAQHVFRRETVTLRCDIYDEGVTSWSYRWYKERSTSVFSELQEHTFSSVRKSDAGKYYCNGSETEGSRRSHTSDTVTLTVSGVFDYHSYTQTHIYISGGPLSALTCCVNVRLLSAIKKISPLIYSQSWVGSWVYTTQAMMTFTLIF